MALSHRDRSGEGQEVEVAMFETMASFMLVEHANGAMFDPPRGRDLAADGRAEPQAVPHQRRLHSLR
jgi:crotonobetainyl-CoA:carnitine CoA-transferase CaiB-like acyl-CoA transferase